MNIVNRFFYDLLIEAGANEVASKYLNALILLILAVVLIFVIDAVLRRILRSISSRIAKQSKTNFDDILIANKTPRNVAHIVPWFLAFEFTPIVFADFPEIEGYIITAIEIFGIVLTLWIVRSILHSIKDYLKTLDSFKDKPIASYIQVFMIFAWFAGFLLAFSILSGQSVLKFLAALGTLSAIIILIFRDTILGFVASIQVSINDMVRIGDWITFEKYGADGDVIEITLATVKVQNFDKTITTIPTYALISESFKNWRGMTNSQGRRIKRSFSIKMNSVKHLSDKDIDQLKSIQLIKDYLTTRQEKIDLYNSENKIDKSLLLNGRNLTNIGVFRKYAENYIKQHSGINKEMMIMVRQLAPTSQGLPLEIYAFSADKRWGNYEYIMADIFDHLIAAVPYFELELFELPSQLTV